MFDERTDGIEHGGCSSASVCSACWSNSKRALETLAANLAIGGALCEAYDKGWDACIESEDSLAAFEGDLQTGAEHDARLAALWSPGCNLPK